MSKATPCNYCSLKSITKRAKENNLHVTNINNNIYVHPKNVDISKLDETEKDKYFAAWMMEIGTKCEC